MQLAAKKAARKRSRAASLHARKASKRKRPRADQSQNAAPPAAGTIDQDRLLTRTVREAANAFNAALANARAAGLEVQQSLVEAETIGDEPMIHAHPVKLGRILRRY